jgi:hypothetical protein
MFLFRIISIAVVFACAAGVAHGAVVPRNVLKTYFETGDIPTQDDFVDVIDSIVDVSWHYDTQSTHSVHGQPLGGGILIHGGGDDDVLRLLPGDPIGPGLPAGEFAASGVLDSLLHATEDRFLLGLRFTINNSSLGTATTHYGFVDLSVEGASSPTPGAIHLCGVAYETEPDTALAAFFVPEPSAAALLVIGSFVLLRRRR